MKIDELITKTARAVVGELKRAGMVKENKLGSFKKTEKILYLYPKWKEGVEVSEDTLNFLRKVDEAFVLSGLISDPYFELINLKYFKGWTHERIAEYFDVDVSVISKRRTKLINQLRPIIFSDDFITELFEM